MSDRITNGELDEILADVKQMWEALGDVAMQVPAAREVVAPRRHLPQVIDMIFDQAKEAASDPGTEKILRDLLDRIYKMNLMAIPALRVTEQDKHSNDPLVAWMSDVRSVLYGGTKPVPDVIRDLQGPKP